MGGFLTEDEYKEDIHEFFCHFDFESPRDESGVILVPPEEQCIDPFIFEQIFEALGKKVSGGMMAKITKQIQAQDLKGVNYPIFEQHYLNCFPYCPESLINEAFAAVDVRKSGSVTAEDMKAAVPDSPDSLIDNILRINGRNGVITLADIKSALMYFYSQYKSCSFWKFLCQQCLEFLKTLISSLIKHRIL
jgi:Ca2+-binding EF-hand superfamily protein